MRLSDVATVVRYHELFGRTFSRSPGGRFLQWQAAQHVLEGRDCWTMMRSRR